MNKKRQLKLYTLFSKIIHFFFNKERLKLWFELSYWKLQIFKEKEFTNFHYKEFFVNYFALSEKFYESKKILDIGCGPRGSLEWANFAAERIGLDPLANDYLKLNMGKHKMTYVEGKSENLPFGESRFDVISSFNSLDHVENVEKTLQEIYRCLKPGGLFLLITDIHAKPTLTEPAAFGWEISDKISSKFKIMEEKHFEGHRLYKSIRKGVAFDHSNPKTRYGVLTIKAEKI